MLATVTSDSEMAWESLGRSALLFLSNPEFDLSIHIPDHTRTVSSGADTACKHAQNGSVNTSVAIDECWGGDGGGA